VGSAVAVILIREKHVVGAFERAGATVPERAVSLDSLGVSNGNAVRRLRDHAVLREAGAAQFYLDVPTWQALRRMRRRIIAALLFVVLCAAAAGVFGWWKR
jgi:hypothetical protein